VLQYHLNWEALSAIAGLAWRNLYFCYFCLFPVATGVSTGSSFSPTCSVTFPASC
jgi:hypothetical protein